MRNFSKSKLLAFRQCPKRLWLEIHRPELKTAVESGDNRLQIGVHVSEVARQVYDPDQHGVTVEVQDGDMASAIAKSRSLLHSPHPVFEAALSGGGVTAFADAMLPQLRDGSISWRMVEVKSSTTVKPYHRDDVAVQAYAATEAGVPFDQVAIANIDSSWIYPGHGEYAGLFKESDLTTEALSRHDEVATWVNQARGVADLTSAPAIETGSHCDDPFACTFYEHCSQGQTTADRPVYWLPRISAAKVNEWAGRGIEDLKDVPPEELNEVQRRVLEHTLNGSTYFDQAGAQQDLAPFAPPIQFLDFETIQFAVPIWAGTRPYQQIPFQFSLHNVLADGQLEHHDFLDLSGSDPSFAFAKALIEACGEKDWPIFAYNASFERSRIRELASRFEADRDTLIGISNRIQDLLPVARARFYHPSQKGSWSIKAVLPAAVPSLRYGDLTGVQDGGMAMDAFLEALHPQTEASRKEELRTQLLAYCKLDTYAMVKLWQLFASRMDWEL